MAPDRSRWFVSSIKFSFARAPREPLVQIRMQPTNSKSRLAALIAETLGLLAEDKRVRLNLAGGGRLHIDRRVPYFCVYRRRPGDADPGTEQLIAGKTAYLVIPAEPRRASQAIQLLRAVIENLSQHFGSFLLVEVWSAPLPSENHNAESNGDAAAALAAPRFQIVTPASRIPPVSKTLKEMSWGALTSMVSGPSVTT